MFNAQHSCNVIGCAGKPMARGFCMNHYKRVRRKELRGDLFGTRRPRAIAPAEERFWKFVERIPICGCWIWTGFCGPGGYGQFSLAGGKLVPAHRFSYELLFGPINHGLECDHLCRTPSCVNPHHIEPVTHKINQSRTPSATKKCCVHGHPYDEKNTGITKNGFRVCRSCARERMQSKREATASA